MAITMVSQHITNAMRAHAATAIETPNGHLDILERTHVGCAMATSNSSSARTVRIGRAGAAVGRYAQGAGVSQRVVQARRRHGRLVTAVPGDEQSTGGSRTIRRARQRPRQVGQGGQRRHGGGREVGDGKREEGACIGYRKDALHSLGMGRAAHNGSTALSPLVEPTTMGSPTQAHRTMHILGAGSITKR